MLSPSIRHTFLSACTAAMVAGYASAQGTPPAPPSLQDMAKSINEISNGIKLLTEKLDKVDGTMNRLSAEVTGLRDDVTALKTKSLASESELRRLNDEIVTLKKRLDEMNRTTNSNSSKVTQTAKVKFSNKYSTDMIVNLNGTTYTVAPNEEREVSVAPGSVVYQVHGYQTSAKYNTLSDNQMLTVTLRPAY